MTIMFDFWKAIGVGYMTKRYLLRNPEKELEVHVSSTTSITFVLESHDVVLSIKANEAKWKPAATGVSIEAELTKISSRELIETVPFEVVWGKSSGIM